MFKFLRDMLASPEAQRDPHYWTTTFLSHTWVGLALWCAVGTLAVALYALWEVVQLAFFRAKFWDSVLDWVAVCFGVLLAYSLWNQAITTTTACVLSLLVIIAMRVR